MALKCESNNSMIKIGAGRVTARGTNPEDLKDHLPQAEIEAMDKAYEQAKAFLALDECQCEEPCERKFVMSIGPTRISKTWEDYVNGDNLAAEVTVTWYVDVDCKLPKKRSGNRRFRPI